MSGEGWSIDEDWTVNGRFFCVEIGDGVGDGDGERRKSVLIFNSFFDETEVAESCFMFSSSEPDILSVKIKKRVVSDIVR